jgi:large subunit ribosomal protein L10
MAVSRKNKELIFSSLNDSIATQKSVLVLSTNGAAVSLNSEQNTTLRKESRKEGIIIRVIKNTLINKAFPALPQLEGQTYLAFLGEGVESDEIKVPKVVTGLTDKEFKDNFIIIGSIVNGEYFDADKTLQLAKTPSFDDSMAMVAGSLNQIATKLAMVIKEIPAGVARGISEVQKTKS